MGRRRGFDVDEALDAALCVFWRKGYEGASYADLTEAAGIERPALYSAFGNKEALFRRALQRYHERHLSYLPEALEMPTARKVVEHLLKGAIALTTRYPEHTGCFVINGALAVSDDAEPVRQVLVEARAEGEAQLEARFERAQAEGDLPESAKPAALAGFVMAVLHGMAVQAKAGFSAEALEAIAEQALSGWPSP